MRELSGDTYWIGPCHPFEGGHMHFGVYLVEAPDGYVLVDAGSRYFREEILEAIESITGPTGVDSVLLTHSTLPHTDNIAAFRDRWGDVEVISASSIPETMGLTGVEVWEIGGVRSVRGREFEFIEPPLTDIAFSLWIHDRESEILYTAEAPGNVHADGACDTVYDGPELDIPYEHVLAFYREQLPWLAYGAPEKIDPTEVFADRSVAFLAPIHGNPVAGKHVDAYLDRVGRAVSELAEASDPRVVQWEDP